MSIVVKKSLVCDYPGCYSVKTDLIWWEADPGERPWEHTRDGRDWCPRHTRDEINAVYAHKQEHLTTHSTGENQ